MTISVRHHAGSYSVGFCPVESVFPEPDRPVMVITDSNVHQAWKHQIPDDYPLLEIPPGEGSKTLETYLQCVELLADQGFTRDGVIFAFGGGVIGDLAGFIAATFLRGVDLVQVPTSLLAMADSSVGGKVGVDLAQGKNLVGAFKPPVEVRIPLEMLATLDMRHFVNGSAEIWKAGFIALPNLLEQLMSQPMSKDDDRLEAILGEAIRMKAQVVEEDEFDTTGRRAILNFGHTVGHALEHVTGYGPLLHGEAVAIGMVVEARLAEQLGIAEAGLSQQIAQGLSSQGLPTDHPALTETEEMLAAMGRDKKATAHGLGFSLVSEFGKCKLVQAVPLDAVQSALPTP